MKNLLSIGHYQNYVKQFKQSQRKASEQDMPLSDIKNNVTITRQAIIIESSNHKSPTTYDKTSSFTKLDGLMKGGLIFFNNHKLLSGAELDLIKSEQSCLRTALKWVSYIEFKNNAYLSIFGI